MNRSNEDLATSLVENYYGSFWIISAICMIHNENISLKDLSEASRSGHGLSLLYHGSENPLEWLIFIQQTGFLNFILKHKPFMHEIDKVSLPGHIGKKQLQDTDDHKSYGYIMDDLISRIPEMEWHYELLTGKAAPIAVVSLTNPGHPDKIQISKKAAQEFIKKTFPSITSLSIDEKGSEKQPKNHFNAEIKDGVEPLPLPYNSLLTDVNTIAPLDKPLKNIVLWHLLVCYAWSIISRYTPHFLQEIDSGKLAEWRPFLDEYGWLVRIVMPTWCLNNLTKSDWKFSPPALWGG